VRQIKLVKDNSMLCNVMWNGITGMSYWSWMLAVDTIPCVFEKPSRVLQQVVGRV